MGAGYVITAALTVVDYKTFRRYLLGRLSYVRGNSTDMASSEQRSCALPVVKLVRGRVPLPLHVPDPII